MSLIATKPPSKLPGKASKATDKPSTTQDLKDEKKAAEKIHQIGSKFMIMFLLWVGNVEPTFQIMLNPNYLPMDLFQDRSKWRQQGRKYDLLKVFAKEYHANFCDGFIPPIFSYGMNNEHSNSASHIRARIGPRIFRFALNLFLKAYWHYENCQ
ncbi:hypothetical protein JB92DRAFT_3107296 [Gautieria morchelliformis]|nr:hypothetical protein JB92DRAFT_3107296 [Gautieria morchelliformis]